MSNITAGARVIFKINGTPVLFANALNYTIQHTHQPLDVLDQFAPAEYTEQSYLINFTCTMFRVPNLDAVSLGLRPKPQDIITQPALTAELIDTVTNTTLLLIEQVKCVSESFSISARDIGQLTLDFVGLKLTSESI
jgi:hypothetical protein